MTVQQQWFCPPEPRHPSAAWCRDLPCRGHRVTKDLHRAALVVAWTDGWLPDPPDDIGSYWASAAQALAAIHAWEANR